MSDQEDPWGLFSSLNSISQAHKLIAFKIKGILDGALALQFQFQFATVNAIGDLQSVSWSLAEFRHNKIVQSPHENYFNVCRQHKEK